MISRTTQPFRKLYADLPKTIRRHAKKAYSIFQNDPRHPSLHFKRVHSTLPIHAVRITKDYRAVGVQQDDEIVWFWIGKHAQYDKLLNRMRNA